MAFRKSGSTGLLGFLVVFGTTSVMVCNDSPTDSGNDSSEYFPIEPGSIWIYRDSVHLTDIIDTIGDSLTQFVSDSNGLLYGEFLETSSFFKSLNMKWQRYFYQRSGVDTIFDYWDNVPTDTPSYVRELFILPFDSGRTWIDTTWSFPRDTYTVVGIEKVYTPATDTQNALHVHCQSHMLNFHRTMDYWFVSDVGLVKVEGRANDYAPQTKELIRYKFPSRRNLRRPTHTDTLPQQ